MIVPQLLTLDDFHEDRENCVKELYRFYLDEIVNANLTFLGNPISFQFRPPKNGMHFGFYHLITEGGPSEEDREINFKRCQRISWIPHILKNYQDFSKIKCWENIRGSSKHIVLWLHQHNYSVILAQRKEYFLLKTAYPIENKHRIRKLDKESKTFPDPRKG